MSCCQCNQKLSLSSPNCGRDEIEVLLNLQGFSLAVANSTSSLTVLVSTPWFRYYSALRRRPRWPEFRTCLLPSYKSQRQAQGIDVSYGVPFIARKYSHEDISYTNPTSPLFPPIPKRNPRPPEKLPHPDATRHCAHPRGKRENEKMSETRPRFLPICRRSYRIYISHHNHGPTHGG